MSRKNAYGRSTVARLASGSSVTTTGTIAMIRGAGRPAAALAISGTIRFESAAGPGEERDRAVGEFAGDAQRLPPHRGDDQRDVRGSGDLHRGRETLGPRADRLAVEVDSVAVEHLA
ncbi:hypothetical protein [Amycolatopsis sp. cmx-11-51]|uniref:hypothetical protein n=1 Tax=Amycolatopsis sp. cmx-11-51 TaxID=2785797 RepID=UPI0039E4A2D0